MSTLYVTDLDGTLLNSEAQLSKYTEEAINSLMKSEMNFTYATARSYSSASKVTKKLSKLSPVIIYNGMFIVDSESGERLFDFGNYMDKACIRDMRALFGEHGISPLVYAYKQGEEKVTWEAAYENDGMRRYFDMRQGDKRFSPSKDEDDLYTGDIFYFTCILENGYDKLHEIYEKLIVDTRVNVILQKEIYAENDWWLEIIPSSASKAKAISFLKNKLGCEKLVVFGDGVNDVSMFKIADEAYAVDNAASELKKIATDVILHNDKDAVARWLMDNYKR